MCLFIFKWGKTIAYLFFFVTLNFIAKICLKTWKLSAILRGKLPPRVDPKMDPPYFNPDWPSPTPFSTTPCPCMNCLSLSLSLSLFLSLLSFSWSFSFLFALYTHFSVLSRRCHINGTLHFNQYLYRNILTHWGCTAPRTRAPSRPCLSWTWPTSSRWPSGWPRGGRSRRSDQGDDPRRCRLRGSKKMNVNLFQCFFLIHTRVDFVIVTKPKSVTRILFGSEQILVVQGPGQELAIQRTVITY